LTRFTTGTNRLSRAAIAAARPRFAGAALLCAVVALAGGCSGNGNNLVVSQPAATATTSLPQAPPPPGAPAAQAASAAAPASASPSFKDKISNFFSGATQKQPQPVVNAEADYDCPYIDIRQGAATLTIPPPPPDGSNEAMSLKYQGSFVRAARECKVVAGQVTMRVGIEGRVIVGPAGGLGQVDVPLRFAVVESPMTAPKTIVTKLVHIPVAVNAQNVPFTYIEEGLTFPMPSAAALDDYIVYIGFDQFASTTQERPRPVAKPKVKPKAVPNPNAPTG
jgi:hypothetical protein